MNGSGQYLCGAVTFAAKGVESHVHACHCSMCRRISGAAFVSWMAIPRPGFKYTKGDPKKLISSSHGARYFCQECGTPMVCVLDEDQKNIYITICSLDEPQEFKPKGDIYVEDMLDWTEK